jgi:hypothetical protein
MKSKISKPGSVQPPAIYDAAVEWERAWVLNALGLGPVPGAAPEPGKMTSTNAWQTGLLKTVSASVDVESDEEVAQHAEGFHYVQDVGAGSSFVDKDADMAASVALREGQDGQGKKLVNPDGSLNRSEPTGDGSANDAAFAASIALQEYGVLAMGSAPSVPPPNKRSRMDDSDPSDMDKDPLDEEELDEEEL